MHARTRVLAVPGSAHDLWAGLHAGPGSTFPRSAQPRCSRRRSGRQRRLRGAASRGPAVAIPPKQQGTRDLRLAPAGGPQRTAYPSLPDPRRRHHHSPRAMRCERRSGRAQWRPGADHQAGQQRTRSVAGCAGLSALAGRLRRTGDARAIVEAGLVADAPDGAQRARCRASERSVSAGAGPQHRRGATSGLSDDGEAVRHTTETGVLRA